MDRKVLEFNRELSPGNVKAAMKVTAKHTHFFAPAVKKAAPVLYDTINEVRNDPAYASISPALREKVEALVKALDDAKAKDGEVSQPEKKAA